MLRSSSKTPIVPVATVVATWAAREGSKKGSHEFPRFTLTIEMPEPSEFTDLQLSILAVLWSRKQATISDLYAELGKQLGVSRATIGTLLWRMEERGVVKHRTAPEGNVYRAVVTKREVVAARVKALIKALTVSPRVASRAAAISPGDIAKGDAARLKQLLSQLEDVSAKED